MEIKEVCLVKGYQVTFTSEEFNSLHTYFYNRWHNNEKTDKYDREFEISMFNKLEDDRLKRVNK